MTQGALETDGLQRLAVLIEEPGHADNRVGLEQEERVRRVVQVDLAGLDGRGHVLRHRLHVDLEAEIQGLFGTDARAGTAEFLALNGLVELQLAAPKILAAKSVEAEDAL